jgi:EpsI family protein
MSTTDVTVAPSAAEQPSVVAGRLGTGIPWARVALACAVLAVAGGARFLQEWRVKSVLESGRVSPFPLKNLPKALGSWQVPGGREEVLDSEIVQVTRCVDYVKRRYVNDQTGVGVELLVLYGPSTIAHRPEVCYPGAGYELLDKARERILSVPGGQAALLSLTFARGDPGAAERQQVFYSLRLGGHWTVDMDLKRLERVPALYKIQVVRPVGIGERLDLGIDPCETFLEAMLPELERQISGAH